MAIQYRSHDLALAAFPALLSWYFSPGLLVSLLLVVDNHWSLGTIDLFLLEERIVGAHRGQQLCLVVEHHRCNQVVFAQKVGEPRHCLAYAAPLVAAHGAADIEIEQDRVVLLLHCQKGLDLFIDQDGCSLTVGHSDDVLPSLQSQLHRDLLEDSADVCVVHSVVLGVLSACLCQEHQLLLCLLRHSHSDEDDLQHVDVEHLPNGVHDLRGHHQFSLGAGVVSVSEDDVDEVPSLSLAGLLQDFVELNEQVTASHKGITEGSAASGLNAGQDLRNNCFRGQLEAQLIEHQPSHCCVDLRARHLQQQNGWQFYAILSYKKISQLLRTSLHLILTNAKRARITDCSQAVSNERV